MSPERKKGGYRPTLEDLEKIASESGFTITKSDRYPTLKAESGNGQVSFVLGLGETSLTYIDDRVPEKFVVKMKPFTEITNAQDLAETIEAFILLPPTEKEILDKSEAAKEKMTQEFSERALDDAKASFNASLANSTVKEDKSLIGSLKVYWKRL
jgi:hypothetical protein